MRVFTWLIALIFLSVVLTAWVANDQTSNEKDYPTPLGLPSIPWPEDNPYTPLKARLGRLLFFDKRLSSDNSVSCASCHSLPKGFGDPHAIATGIHGRAGKRHTPSIINSAFNSSQFWDGRAKTLEEQALRPIANINEMTLEEDQERAYLACEKKIQQITEYRPLFKKVFGKEKGSMQDVAKAIATFERTLISGNSAFDRYQAGEWQALTPEQIQGYEVFNRSGCIVCHSGFNFTEGSFANIGIGMNKPNPDLGRYEVTRDPKDWGAFKVPTLRDIRLTGPYMHDGSLKTLEEVVDYYNHGGIPNPNLDPLIRPLHLTQQEKKNLILFLESLTGEGWEKAVYSN